VVLTLMGQLLAARRADEGPGGVSCLTDCVPPRGEEPRGVSPEIELAHCWTRPRLVFGETGSGWTRTTRQRAAAAYLNSLNRSDLHHVHALAGRVLALRQKLCMLQRLSLEVVRGKVVWDFAQQLRGDLAVLRRELRCIRRQSLRYPGFLALSGLVAAAEGDHRGAAALCRGMLRCRSALYQLQTRIELFTVPSLNLHVLDLDGRTCHIAARVFDTVANLKRRISCETGCELETWTLWDFTGELPDDKGLSLTDCGLHDYQTLLMHANLSPVTVPPRVSNELLSARGRGMIAHPAGGYLVLCRCACGVTWQVQIGVRPSDLW